MSWVAWVLLTLSLVASRALRKNDVKVADKKQTPADESSQAVGEEDFLLFIRVSQKLWSSENHFRCYVDGAEVLSTGNVGPQSGNAVVKEAVQQTANPNEKRHSYEAVVRASAKGKTMLCKLDTPGKWGNCELKPFTLKAGLFKGCNFDAESVVTFETETRRTLADEPRTQPVTASEPVAAADNKQTPADESSQAVGEKHLYLLIRVSNKVAEWYTSGYSCTWHGSEVLNATKTGPLFKYPILTVQHRAESDKGEPDLNGDWHAYEAVVSASAKGKQLRCSLERQNCQVWLLLEDGDSSACVSPDGTKQLVTLKLSHAHCMTHEPVTPEPVTPEPKTPEPKPKTPEPKTPRTPTPNPPPPTTTTSTTTSSSTRRRDGLLLSVAMCFVFFLEAARPC